MDRALAALKKTKKAKARTVHFDSYAIQLLYDAQDTADKLFQQLETSNERFELKVLMMDLLSRLIGVHHLFVLGFYPFVERYMQPSRKEVTKVMVYAAQASHELLPPDVMRPLILTIANNFISERNSGETMAIGLNTVREICSRCPLAIDQDLLSDLVQYKSYKNKSVMNAAKSLIQLFREVNPKMLQKKLIGRPTEATKALLTGKDREYGDIGTVDYLPGAEVLPQVGDEDFEEDDGEFEECSNDENESDGEWENVSRSDDESAKKSGVDLTVMSKADQVARAQTVSTDRILTQEDYSKLEARQVSQSLTHGNLKRAREPEGKQMNSVTGELVRLRDVESMAKRKKHDKEARVAAIMSGRDGRGKFSCGKTRQNPNASTSNAEKRKGKAFTMVKHKIGAAKKHRSFRDKQISLRNSLLKRSKVLRK